MPIINLVYEAPENSGWKPWSNTLAYLPLDSTNTKNDTYWWNTTTQLWTVRYWTYWWVDCADFTTWWCIYSNMLNWVSTYTVLIWANNINWNSASNWYWWNVFCVSKSWGSYQPWIYYWNSSSSNWYFAFYANNSSWDIYFNTNTKNHWFLLAMCISSSTKKAYLFGDWSYKELDISNSTTNSQYVQIWGIIYNNLTERTDRRFYWYLSNLIIENKVWTDQEIQDYYNLTKWNYWL